jgi:hypothetical protein
LIELGEPPLEAEDLTFKPRAQSAGLDRLWALVGHFRRGYSAFRRSGEEDRVEQPVCLDRFRGLLVDPVVSPLGLAERAAQRGEADERSATYVIGRGLRLATLQVLPPPLFP